VGTKLLLRQNTANKERGKTMKQVVFTLEDQGGLMPEIRGGKGKSLAELVRLGVPVPPGLTISTSVARAYAQNGKFPVRLHRQMTRGIGALERQTGLGFGDSKKPLLLSVRSGARQSMPGMMDTVLDLGLNLKTVEGLAEYAGGNERFALDCYRRFLAMYGEVVMDVDEKHFEGFLCDYMTQENVAESNQLSVKALWSLCHLYRELIEEEAKKPVPDEPMDQLFAALRAVFGSWDSARAQTYRHINKIPDWWGTAANIQAMVFGNMGDDSCSGVVFSCDQSTGQDGLYGEWLPNAQGEDVVAGTRQPLPIEGMRDWNDRAYEELNDYVQTMRRYAKGEVDIEFTVQRSEMFILQWRPAKMTPLATVTRAVHRVWSKGWTHEQALAAVDQETVDEVSCASISKGAVTKAKMADRLFASGKPASSGAATGIAVFSAKKAVEKAAAGHDVILIVVDTTPKDLAGIIASKAIVTHSGGTSCHAAIVAREKNKPAVVGCSSFSFTCRGSEGDYKIERKDGIEIREGEVVTVDGDRGLMFCGPLPIKQFKRTKEVRIFLNWVARHANSKCEPRIDFGAIDERINMQDVCNDFYIAEAMMLESRKSALYSEACCLRNTIHQEATEKLALYLFLAVAGELRHAFYKEANGNYSYSWTAVQAQMEFLQSQYGYEYDDDRLPMQSKMVTAFSEKPWEAHIAFFDLAIEVFLGIWPGTTRVGGKAWADIAATIRDFLKGEWTSTEFVDHAFDLSHNGGILFDKHPMMSDKTSEGVLSKQLNVKKTVDGVEQRMSQMLGHHDHLSPEVKNLYEKGKTLGLWS